MPLALRLTTAPEDEPITLEDAKVHCKLGSDECDEDAYVQSLIKMAREAVEEATCRALITQTRELRLDGFPCDGDDADDALEIPRPPLASISSIKYIDTAGTLQTWDPALYQVDIFSEPGRVLPAYGQVWPITRPVLGAVRIEFVCGFGDEPTDVPEPLRQAIRLLVGDAYAIRESQIVGVSIAANPAVAALIAPYRVLWIGQGS